ncbi:MAG TPA: hypothetical protein VN643_15185 [Pyrinomonadaceae bacterium]|nr:hypothetical protein [Pyrinomonadaceae bacterium]
MKKELTILNLICVLGALGLLVFAVLNAIFSPDFLSIDNLFITAVFLVLALMFAASPLLYLKSEGKLPIPFIKRSGTSQAALAGSTGASSGPALLDAKGRAVPPDVRSMVGRFTPAERKDN